MDAEKNNPQSPVQPQGPVDEQTLAEMTMQEISARLDRVTSHIETERERERQARTAYDEVAAEVRQKIEAIRREANRLADEQRRRLEGFTEQQTTQHDISPVAGRITPTFAEGIEPKAARPAPPRTLEDAILAIWSHGVRSTPLTTDEIAKALPEVGYESKAVWRSLKSTVNQALAKLCNSGRMEKFRIDGSPLPKSNPNFRARRYMPPRDPEQDGTKDSA